MSFTPNAASCLIQTVCVHFMVFSLNAWIALGIITNILMNVERNHVYIEEIGGRCYFRKPLFGKRQMNTMSSTNIGE